MESKFYENYLAYIRKTKTRKFSKGEKILFRYPEQHGLVLLPNCEGVVSEVLPFNYYSVSYKLPNGKEASTVLYSNMMVGMHGCVPSHAVADEDEYRMDFVSRIRHFAVTLRESLTSKAVVTTNAYGQSQDSSTDHLALSIAHLDNSPGLSSPSHGQAHLQAHLENLESSSHVHSCAQVVTSPSLESSCQVHPPTQIDSSPSLEPLYQVAEGDDLLQAAFDSIGMKVCELPHPSAMIDLFSFSCDLGFLSVTTEDVEFSKICSKYHTAILGYLHKQQFQYYLSGIHAWESSRSNTQLNLKQSLSQKTLPYYVPPSHTCMDCVSRMCSCNHPCCKEWYIKAGMKCGFIKKIEGGSPGVTQYIIHEDINATTVSETNTLSLSQIFSSPLLTAASRKRSKTTSTGGYSAKRKKGQPKPKVTSKCKKQSTKYAPKCAYSSTSSTHIATSVKQRDSRSHVLRGTAPFDQTVLFKRKSASLYPMTLSKRRIQSVLAHLTDAQLEVFVEKCSRCLESWEILTCQEKNNLSMNVRYASSVLQSSTDTPLLNAIKRPAEPFLQQQADSNLCGLCVLNNLYQTEQFFFSDLNDIADDLWHSHWTEMGMSPTEPVQSMRSTMGDYSIDVLDAAVAKAGDKLVNITPSIRNFMQVHGSGHYLISTPEILRDSIVTPEQNLTMLLLKHVSYHYTCLQIESCGSMWWLDSRRNEPVSLSPLYLYTILKKEFSKCTTSAALFILERHDVAHTSLQIQLHAAGNCICLLNVF